MTSDLDFLKYWEPKFNSIDIRPEMCFHSLANEDYHLLLSERASQIIPIMVSLHDKNLMKDVCIQHGFSVPRRYYYSPKEVDLTIPLNQNTHFVAKPCHMAESEYVYIMKDGINIINNTSITITELNKALNYSFQAQYLRSDENISLLKSQKGIWLEMSNSVLYLTQ